VEETAFEITDFTTIGLLCRQDISTVDMCYTTVCPQPLATDHQSLFKSEKLCGWTDGHWFIRL